MSHIVICSDKGRVGYFSFTTGFVASPQPVLKSEDDILAHALWLERHGREEEALAFLERRCPKG